MILYAFDANSTGTNVKPRWQDDTQATKIMGAMLQLGHDLGVPVVHDLPGGARRLKQKSSGILATIVGGAVYMREGEHTGALPGRLVRSA